MDDATHTEVQQLLAAYERAWGAKDFAGLEALWDADEPAPMYVPEESPQPLLGWQAIRDYWAVTAKWIERIQVTTSDLHLRQLSPTVMLALYQMHWDARIGGQAPIGNDVRVFALLRRTSNGWRFCHYSEAPLASMVQVRQMHQRNVRPEFLT